MKKILVIDDDREIVDALGSFLTEEGFSVRTAGDGEEGLTVFQDFRPDVVLTDILMPKREGIETILELKRRSPELRIIAMSGGGIINASTYLEVASRMGASAVLKKPFNLDELLKILKSCDL